MTKKLPCGIYISRASAVRAARAACQKALKSPIYQAHEGHDFDIMKDAFAEVMPGQFEFNTFRFRLVGPAKEAST